MAVNPLLHIAHHAVIEDGAPDHGGHGSQDRKLMLMAQNARQDGRHQDCRSQDPIPADPDAIFA